MSITPRVKPNEPSPIQQRSSPSAKIFWLDLTQIRDCLEQAAIRLGETHPEIETIWLFGSLARGDAVPGSDADLLIVLSNSPLPFLDRSVYYQPDFCGIGVDVLAYTKAELASMKEEPVRQAQVEGTCLFERADNASEAGASG